jgi:hypothetical protein
VAGSEEVDEMLVAVPLRNQLNEVTTDKRIDENAHKNCVAACVAAVLSVIQRFQECVRGRT